MDSNFDFEQPNSLISLELENTKKTAPSSSIQPRLRDNSKRSFKIE